MKYLLILNVAVLAMATTLAVLLGVVWILYSFHTELSARVGNEMPSVAIVMACFALTAGFSGVSSWSLVRDKAWQWWAQGGAVLGIGACMFFLYRFLGA